MNALKNRKEKSGVRDRKRVEGVGGNKKKKKKKNIKEQENNRSSSIIHRQNEKTQREGKKWGKKEIIWKI